MKGSIENGFLIPGPYLGHRKTGPGIEIFNREWKFQTENENLEDRNLLK